MRPPRFNNLLDRFRIRFLFAQDGLAADLTRRIQVWQLDSWVRVSLGTIPVGTAVALVLYATYWDRRDDLWLDAGVAGILASYAVLYRYCLRWKRPGDVPPDVVRAMRHLLIIRTVLGSCWAVAIVAMMAVSDPTERMLIFALSIGLISTAVFGGPSIYALSFWLPVTLGAFGTLFTTGSLLAVAPLVCLSCYAALTLMAILSSDRQVIERSLNMIRLEQHAETIGILLRDFEESSSDWLWETDGTLTLRHVSPRFAEVAQRDPAVMETSLCACCRDPGPKRCRPQPTAPSPRCSGGSRRTHRSANSWCR